MIVISMNKKNANDFTIAAPIRNPEGEGLAAITARTGDKTSM
jgi:hypothetical protein